MCHTDTLWCSANVTQISLGVTQTQYIYMVQYLVINTDSDITHRLFRRLRDVLISKAFRKECRIKIAKGINWAQQHANMQFNNEKPSLTKSVQSEKKIRRNERK